MLDLLSWTWPGPFNISMMTNIIWQFYLKTKRFAWGWIHRNISVHLAKVQVGTSHTGKRLNPMQVEVEAGGPGCVEHCGSTSTLASSALALPVELSHMDGRCIPRCFYVETKSLVQIWYDQLVMSKDAFHLNKLLHQTHLILMVHLLQLFLLVH